MPGSVLSDPVIAEIAKKHGRTPAQIIFAWHHHHGFAILCQTSKPSRLEENIGFFDIKLSEDEINAINGLNKGLTGRLYDPLYIPAFDFNC